MTRDEMITKLRHIIATASAPDIDQSTRRARIAVEAGEVLVALSTPAPVGDVERPPAKRKK